MKRPLTWVVLSLAIAALMLGAKWRVEHPLTEESIEVRTLLSRSSTIQITHWPAGHIGFKKILGTLSKKEAEPFIDSLYCLPQSVIQYGPNIGTKGNLDFNWMFEKPDKNGSIGVNVNKQSDSSPCRVYFIDSPDKKYYNLHPITIKRWLELLLANPRIGPALRARIK